MTSMKQEEIKSDVQIKAEMKLALDTKLGADSEDIISQARDIVANSDVPMSTHDIVFQLVNDNPDLRGKIDGNILNNEMNLADDSTQVNDVEGRKSYMAIAVKIEGDGGDAPVVEKKIEG
jgi:hypothetical protein